MENGRTNFYLGLGGLAAAVYAYATYLRQTLTIAAGYDAAAAVAAAAFAGVAVGAALVAVVGRRADRNIPGTLSLNAALAGATALVLGAAVVHLPLGLNDAAVPAGVVVAVYVLAAVCPLVFAGFAVGLAFRARADEPHRLFAAFLSGGAAAALLSAAAFDLFGAPAALALVPVLAAAASASFNVHRPKIKIIPAAALAAVAVVVAAALPFIFNVAPSPDNALGKAGAIIKAAAWSATSRAEISLTPDNKGLAPAVLTFDGARPSPLVDASASLKAVDFDGYLAALPNHIRAPGEALVIGGGTYDALAIAALGKGRVTVVTDDAAAEFINRPGSAGFKPLRVPRVAARGGNGRAFVRGGEKNYDLILLSPALVPAPGETVPALRPDYLFTVDAFREYYRHLNPEGIIAAVVPEGPEHALGLKLATVAFTACREESEFKPARCVAVFRRAPYVAVVANKGGWGELEVEALKGSAGREFAPLYLPGLRLPLGVADQPYEKFFATADKESFYRGSRYDIRPNGDGRPYPLRISKRFGAAGGPAFTLGVAAAVIPLAIIFLLVPLYCFQRQCVRTGGKAAFALYFLLFGFASAVLASSLGINIAFYLGGGSWSEPVARALWFAIAGGGSILSARLARRRWLPFLCVAAAVALYLAFYDGLLAATAGWLLFVRVYVAAVLIALPGLFLGGLAPAGLAATAGREQAIVPWAWAAFGFAYAFGTTAFPLITSAFGLHAANGLALVALAGAWGAFTWAARTSLPPLAEEGGK